MGWVVVEFSDPPIVQTGHGEYDAGIDVREGRFNIPDKDRGCVCSTDIASDDHGCSVSRGFIQVRDGVQQPARKFFGDGPGARAFAKIDGPFQGFKAHLTGNTC